ncbi:MAG TPA: adenosylcobinamide-GDP ribazoletransferase [Actinomycetota bacterium]|nr:adenosylcobinamide-GDP ribazoletransferase [Actinomycetota bacterium]
MSGLATALAFYTRVPLGRAATEAGDLAAAAPWFPVAGAAVGAAIAGVYAGLGAVLPRGLAAAVAIAFGAALTGAFHEDGLADVADAFGGGHTPERRLEILDDPRLGTFGVLATAAAFVVRVTAVSALGTYDALAVLPAAGALSRAPAVVLMRRQRAARRDGLAATLAGGIGPAQELGAVASAAAIAAVSLGVWAAPSAVVAVVVPAAMAFVARKKIGGTSGDVLGATQQLVDLGVLVLAAAVVHEAWGELAWWAP